MIIFRYLNQQILQVTVAVSLILLIVGLISRFIQYLGQAVSGELASDVLLLLMFYRLPDFLLVIVPLAFLLGILLVYGRMHEDNEMVVLLNSGLSQSRLLGLTFITSIFIFVLMGIISLSLAPWGARNAEQISQSQEQLTELDLIVAGQFQSFGDGTRVTYTERTNFEEGVGRRLENVFVALNRDSGDEELEQSNPRTAPRVVFAEFARPIIDDVTGARFMQMENVYQYDGEPGLADFSVAQIDVQSVLLPEPTNFQPTIEEESLKTSMLFGSSAQEHQAELQWRLSIMLLVPVLTLIAVPLSRVEPRQGRYGRLIPAVMLYASYFFLLQFARDAVADGTLSAKIGLWWVHLLYGTIGIAAHYFPTIWQRGTGESSS